MAIPTSLAVAAMLGLMAGVVSAQTVAVLKDDLPVTAATASPDYLGEILRQAGMRAEFVSCAQLADPQVLNRARVEVLVLPYGEAFPLPAVANFRRFLRDGGKFFSTGGYAFDRLLVPTAGGWELAPPPARPPSDHVVWRRSFRAEELREQGRLTFSCFMKTAGVAGEGMAYLAVYHYDRDGAVAEFIDFAKVKGTRDWAQFRHTFRVNPRATRVELQAGLYHCRGTAWFDDAELSSDKSGAILAEGFEADFQADGNPMETWARSDARYCRVQTNVWHSGQQALETKLGGEGPEARWVNTRHGRPGDGLETGPEQLGVFDADYALERVAFARAAPEQCIVSNGFSMAGRFEGWAACGVTGSDAARWFPLINGYDRYGRLRGALGAVLRHSSGHYAGSSWTFFGVTNRNLFAPEIPGMAEALVATVRSLARDTYLAWLAPDRGCYRQGEPVALQAKVFNGGKAKRDLRLTLDVYEGEPPESGEPPEGRWRKSLAERLSLAPGEAKTVTLRWEPGRFQSDFYYVRGRLWEGDEEIDRLASGFIVWTPEVVARGPRVSLRDNYLRLGNRPRFLFGTDDWGYVFNTRRETPLQWLRDMRQRRDFGVQIYENLQFGMIPPFTSGDTAAGEERLRKVDGIVQLAQKYQQVYFAGLLIGYNTAASDKELKMQADFCREFARRYAGVPGLIHYLNGDLRCELGPNVAPHLNESLRERYGTTERWREAWGAAAEGVELGSVEAEDFADWGRDWEDLRAYDLNQFRAWVIRRWHRSLLGGIRDVDPSHLTSSEFYQLPHSGVDLPAGIDGLDLCNFGYFDKPQADLARFPAICKYNDQRARGKSVGPGEYGVKTHPGWGDGKDYAYHTTRTREQASELFLGIAHYSLGLGASRIHNWCWKDDANRVFPWGMVYPCDGVPKPIAAVHRNQSLLFGLFRPVYEAPTVFVLTPDCHRFGGGKWQVIEGVLKCFDLALAAHVDNLGTLNELGLEIPKSARAIFYPLPFCLSDETYAKVLKWVQQGGTLYVSGDISYDESRRRTRTERLEQLCGARFIAECYPNIAVKTNAPADQPCIRVEPVRARVLERTGDGLPLVMENRVGKGKVLFTPDPREIHSVGARRDRDLALYRTVLERAGVQPLAIEPDDPLLHVFRVPLEGGGRVWVLFNTDPTRPARTVTLKGCRPPLTVSVASHRPALVWGDARGALRAVETQGDCVIGGQRVVTDTTRGILLALDGRDLRRSEALLLMPLEPGRVRIAREKPLPDLVLEVGELRGGLWRSFESMPVAAGGSGISVEISADQAESLLLLASQRAMPRWRSAVGRWMAGDAR